MGEGNGDEEIMTLIPGEAKDILVSLASRWEDVTDPEALTVTRLKGAMTNPVYEIYWTPAEKAKPPKKVLVRIYGRELEVFFDRLLEVQTFECMSKHGQGPRLLGRFLNGRIEEFIHARTLSASDLLDPEVSALIAAKLREFHDLQMNGPRDVILWKRLRDWLSAARHLCPSEEAEEFTLDAIEMAISQLESALSGENQLIGFCHNDLQYGNIMIDESINSITIIIIFLMILHLQDYEYASYNPIAYDLANHFCEMAADYHTETPHVLYFDKYPDLEERRKFIQVYLSSSGNEPSDLEVEQLVQDAENYVVEHVNGIDFDYIAYAKQRFEQYQFRKTTLLVDSSFSPPPPPGTNYACTKRRNPLGSDND